MPTAASTAFLDWASILRSDCPILKCSPNQVRQCSLLSA
jgi:hypothetical protein